MYNMQQTDPFLAQLMQQIARRKNQLLSPGVGQLAGIQQHNPFFGPGMYTPGGDIDTPPPPGGESLEILNHLNWKN